MLCPECIELCALVNPLQDVDLPHHETVRELVSSAASGCQLCRIIARACLEKSQPSAKEQAELSSRVALCIKKDMGVEISLAGSAPPGTSDVSRPPKPLVTYVIFGEYTLPPRVRSALSYQASENTSTGSEAAFQLVSAWLDECLRTHDACRACADAEPQLPHRVLDVGPADGTAEPRLLETSGAQAGSYITLSHCWGAGSSRPLTTTRANLEAHRRAIPLRDLPRTFRDAVSAARRLACRYLWIDSLCIVQDDRRDWAAEAPRMHRYYRRALLTLAAADAGDSAAGLFRAHPHPHPHPHPHQHHRPCALRVAGGRRELHAFTNSMSFELARSGLAEAFRPSRLYGRAWVLQEQALSPRTLTYARDRVAWRCQEVVFDERAPFRKPVRELVEDAGAGAAVTRRGDPRVIDAQIAALQRDWIFARPRAAGDGRHRSCGIHDGTACFSSEDEFLIQWGNIVAAYTQRQLTYQTDKLVAIQGIADAMVPIVSKSYFAGNWVDTPRAILMSMLWSAKSVKPDSTKLSIAPSWAWASTECEVMFPGHLDHGLVSKITIQGLHRSEAADTSIAAAGTLSIEADVKLAVMKSGQLYAVFDRSPKLLEASHIDISRVSEKPLKDVAAAIAIDDKIENNALVWLAEVAVGVNPTRREGRQVHGLILTQSKGDDGSQFRRVGYSIWQQHRWLSEDLPDSRRMHLDVH